MELVGDHLSIERGERRIVDGVSFALASGDALIVTGENGSGKSTLLRAIAGLLPIAGGSLTVTADDADERTIGELCHYLGHLNAMKGALSVRENLIFWQAFHGDPRLDPEQALHRVRLSHTIDLPFSYLSAGQKRRVSIARLLVSHKPVWIVDEPTAALDKASSDDFRELCQDYCADGGILVAATHLPLGLKGAQSLELQRLESWRDRFTEPAESVPA